MYVRDDMALISMARHWQVVLVRFPAQATDISIYKTSRRAVGFTELPIQKVTGEKRTVLEADH